MSCYDSCPEVPHKDLCTGRKENVCGAYAVFIARTQESYKTDGDTLRLGEEGNTAVIAASVDQMHELDLGWGLTEPVVDLTDKAGQEDISAVNLRP